MLQRARRSQQLSLGARAERLREAARASGGRRSKSWRTGYACIVTRHVVFPNASLAAICTFSNARTSICSFGNQSLSSPTEHSLTIDLCQGLHYMVCLVHRPCPDCVAARKIAPPIARSQIATSHRLRAICSEFRRSDMIGSWAETQSLNVTVRDEGSRRGNGRDYLGFRRKKSPSPEAIVVRTGSMDLPSSEDASSSPVGASQRSGSNGAVLIEGLILRSIEPKEHSLEDLR